MSAEQEKTPGEPADNPVLKFNERLIELLGRAKAAEIQSLNIAGQLLGLDPSQLSEEVADLITRMDKSQEYLASVVNDYYWINAMNTIGLDATTIMKIWDLKDNQSSTSEG